MSAGTLAHPIEHTMNPMLHTRRRAPMTLRVWLFHPSARVNRPELATRAVNTNGGDSSSFPSSSSSAAAAEAASFKHAQDSGNGIVSREPVSRQIRGHNTNAAAPANSTGATATQLEPWQGSRSRQQRHNDHNRQQQQQQRTNGGYSTKLQRGSFSGGAPSGHSNALKSALPDDIDALYHQMQHLGSRWADLHAEAELLEESKKCVLASITLHYMNDGDNKSAGETKAFAAPEYREHVQKMVEARRRANQAKVEFEGMKAQLNLTRTYEASRREEMKLL